MNSNSGEEKSKMETPLVDHELEDAELHLQFDELMNDVYNNMWSIREQDEIKVSCEDLNERIHLEVSAKPILVKIVSKNHLNWLLLMTACEKLKHEWSCPAIKFLIEMNPSV